MEGLEPPPIAGPDPKSGVAANYTTRAIKLSGLNYNNLRLGLRAGIVNGLRIGIVVVRI